MTVGKWALPRDQRETGEKYPNYNIQRTVSGHEIMTDDSDGAESLTIKHRTGSLIQFQADGSIVMRNEKNKFEITFGDNKVLITGCHDVTVNGGASLKVEGDYDLTVNGNMNTAVKGNMDTVVNGNQNTLVKGNQDTGIDGAQTTKVKGNSEHTTEGKTYVGADGGVRVEATGGKADFLASSDVTVKAGGATLVEAAADTSVKGANVRIN